MFYLARRQVEIGVSNRAKDPVQRQPQRLDPVGVQLDSNLAVEPSPKIHLRNAQVCEECSQGVPDSTPGEEMLKLQDELDRLAAQLGAASATLSSLSARLTGEESPAE